MLCESVEMEEASEGAIKARLSHVDSGALDGAVDVLTDEEGSRSSDSFFPADANVSDINVLDTGALLIFLSAPSLLLVQAAPKMPLGQVTAFSFQFLVICSAHTERYSN